MAGETLSGSSIDEIVNTEWIDPLIGDYMKDALVIADERIVRIADLRNKATKTYTFAAWVKDVGADITTEGTTTLSANDFTTTDVQCTVAQVGILREPTKLAERVQLLGEQGFQEAIAQDGGYLCKEMAEDDLAALFASVTLNAGVTNTTASVSTAIEALAKRRTAKANGAPVFIWDDKAAQDFVQSLGSTTGSLWTGGNGQNVMENMSAADGFMGTFLGAPMFYTNLTDTINAAVDVCSACLNAGGKNPSLVLAILWMPELERDLNIAKTTRLYAINMAYGAALINDAPTVKITSKA